MNAQVNNPCPFCGDAVDPAGWLGGDGTRGPECEGCGSTAPSMEVWNKRALDEAALEEANKEIATLKQQATLYEDQCGQLEQRIKDMQAAPPESGQADEIVTRLYRRFKEWSQRGFGPEDVTWCEVKADIVAMIALQPAAAAPSISNMERALQQVMARLADLLGEDQFNNIEAIVLDAGVRYPDECAAAPSLDVKPLIADINAAITMAAINWKTPYAVTRLTTLLRECIAVIEASPPAPVDKADNTCATCNTALLGTTYFRNGKKYCSEICRRHPSETKESSTGEAK